MIFRFFIEVGRLGIVWEVGYFIYIWLDWDAYYLVIGGIECVIGCKNV